MVLMILMGCVAVFPVIGSASSDALSAQAYILNNGDETNTHIYVVFNKKITDYSTAVLYNRTVNGEVLAEVLSTIAQENEYTLKYTIAAGNSYVVPWKFTNVSGSLHYTVTPKAGEAELPLADTAGIRNGDQMKRTGRNVHHLFALGNGGENVLAVFGGEDDEHLALFSQNNE